MLLIQIILTVVAWNKGYKAMALLPVGITLFIGFMIGFANPGITDAELMSYVWIDALAVFILIAMIITAKKHIEQPAVEDDDYEYEYSEEDDEAYDAEILVNNRNESVLSSS